MDLDTDLKSIKESLLANPKILVLLVYGSVASNTHNQNSDIDLAFLATDFSNDDFMELINRVNSVTKHEIDIVDLNKTSPVLSMQIMKNHQILFNRGAEYLSKWKMKTLGMYHDWKITTREIRDNLSEYSVLD